MRGAGGQQEQASSRNDTHLQASGAALSAVFACRMHYETMSKRRPAGQGHAGRQSRETLLFASATRSIAFDTCQPNLKTQVPAQTAFTFSLHGAVLTTNTTLRIPLRHNTGYVPQIYHGIYMCRSQTLLHRRSSIACGLTRPEAAAKQYDLACGLFCSADAHKWDTHSDMDNTDKLFHTVHMGD